MRRALIICLAGVAIAGCGGSGARPKPSRADVRAFDRAVANVSNECLGVSPDEQAMSAEVTALVALYQRNDPTARFRAPNGSTLTMRQAIDTIIAGLQTCDPTLGQRLQSETQ